MRDHPRIYPSLPEYTPLFNKCIWAALPESTPPSQNIPPFSRNLYVRPCQNLPLPPRKYPLFNKCIICDPPRTYPPPPPLPEYTPLISQFICATLPESTPPSQNKPPLSANMCDPARIYPSLPEYTPLISQFICATLPESTPTSPNIPPFQQMYNMRSSQNLPPPPLPEYTPPISQFICATLPESTPPPSQNIPPLSANMCDPASPSQNITPLSANLYVRPCQNLLLPPRIYPPYQPICATLPEPTPPPLSEYTPLISQFICATLPESTPPSQNIPPLSANMCDPARTYPPPLSEYTPLISQFICATLPESTPSSQNIPLLSANLYVWPSQNLPLPARIYPPYQPIYMCDPARIYSFLPEYSPLISQFICVTLPESTPPCQNIPPLSANLYVRPCQNLPLYPRIYPPYQTIYMCDPPRIYPFLPEYTPLFNSYKIMRLSQNPPFHLRIVFSSESTRYWPKGDSLLGSITDSGPTMTQHRVNVSRLLLQCHRLLLLCLCSFFNPLTAKLFNCNFHSLEVVYRWRDPQLQVSKIYSYLTKCMLTVFKSGWLMPRLHV